MTDIALQIVAIAIGVIVAVGGWLYNARKEREFRKFELRTKYRIEALEKALDAIISLTEREPDADRINERFAAARTAMGIFGTDQEVREFEQLIRMIETRTGNRLEGENLNAFPKLLVANFRNEIGLPPRSPELEPKD